MDSPALMVCARVLLSAVFVGLGTERLLVHFGLLPQIGAGISTGALAFAVVELLAGLLILFGWGVRWVAWLLAAFLAVDAVLSHPFWRFSGAEQHAQLLHFLKNVSLIGAYLLLVWAVAMRSSAGRRRFKAQRS